IELVSGMPWEEFVLTRLLKPLGMDRSNLSVGETQRADDFSQPHERRGETIERIPFREFDQMGPAGGINSCVDDMLLYLRAQLGDGGGVFSADAIAQMHGGQIVIPEDRTFPESTRHAYGLGWLVGRYRGQRIVEHNGGVDGFLADCMMLPDLGIGVVVLTNLWSFIGPTIAYRAFDELLGLEPIDWSERLKSRSDAARAGRSEAKGERPRVEGAAPLRALEEYAGDYEHPGYGKLSIAVEDGALIPRFGTLQLSLTHRHYDVFDLAWLELAEQDIRFALSFLTGPDGDVVALTVPFEESVDPIRFDRQPDPRARDPRVLAGLTGRYEMGPVALVVARKAEDTLTVATPGNPAAELVPGRGLRFSLQDAGQTVEFVLDDAGRVEKLVVQPLGVFLPKR
ncbi:MAG: serine hydrolase, partial [Actinomycetota bacterium]